LKKAAARDDTYFQNLRCEELDLPRTLNIPRYLGDRFDLEEQKTFHYLEKFRVDNIEKSSAHRIMFKLKDPTMVRFVAPIHKHIELDLELR
jgi:hypothetical protein